MATSLEEIRALLDAAFPVVLVASHEERRVEGELLALEQTRATESSDPVREVFTWSLTRGFVQVRAPGAKGDAKVVPADSPVAALVYIAEAKTGLFILRDFTQFLNGSASYVVARRLKDLCYTIRDGGRDVSVIILDSSSELPARLEKTVAVLDFDLPTRAEIYKHWYNEALQLVDLKGRPRHEIATIVGALADAATGLTMEEIENVVARSIQETGTIDASMIVREKKAIVRKSGVLEFLDCENGLSDVGGLDNLKSWLRVRAKGFSQAARDYGLPSPRGLLMVGCSGAGKTYTARAIGREWNMPVLKMDVGSLFGSLVGESEGKMRRALKTAEVCAPCVVFVDEIEKSLGTGKGSLDGGTTSRVFSTFLTWMSDKKAPVFVVATANSVDALPPEFLRRGRWDELENIGLLAA